MAFLRIRGWDAHYENNRSRALENLTWFACPNRFDGKKFSRLVSTPTGVEAFGVFILLCEAASRCPRREGADRHGNEATVRGDLIDDHGEALTPSELAFQTRAPEKRFTDHVPMLVQIGWLELIESSHEEGDVWIEVCGSAGKKDAVAKKVDLIDEAKAQGLIPFCSPPYLTTLQDWVDYRSVGKSKLTMVSLKRQLTDMAEWGETESIASMNASIRNGWRGLFLDKKSAQGTGKRSSLIPE